MFENIHQSRVDNLLALRTFIVVNSIVELAHGFLRSSSVYANLGFKVEFSA